MKENPVLIIMTHLKPIFSASLQISEIMAFASSELQASGLRNRGPEYKNE